jgi:tRNA(fMet)-specific endonuclease VapC
MKKNVIVDTDILSYYLKGRTPVVENFNNYVSNHGKVYISRISVIEIIGGLKIRQAHVQLEKFRILLSKHEILDTSEISAEISANIFAELQKIGRHSGNFDILIAGIAIANDLALVTNNERDYKHIQGLELLNWTLTVE